MFRSSVMQDCHLSSPSSAPEVDHARLAPECQTDDTAPQSKVTPGRDAQVYYNPTLPEAIEIDVPDTTHQAVATYEAPGRGSRKKLVVRLIAIAITITVLLSIGLGVGLKLRDKSAPPAAISNNSSTPEEPHALMDDTPISVIKLPDNNRHLYFREKTGAIRRAVYSPSTQVWQTSIDARLLVNARAGTPIAITPHFLFDRGQQTIRRDGISDIPNNANIFYVNSTGQLDCIEWHESSNEVGCGIPYWPQVSVSPDLEHILAGLRDWDDDELGLLLSFQNPTGDLVSMLGSTNTTEDPIWTWQNRTDTFARSQRSDGYNLTDFCGALKECDMQGDSVMSLRKSKPVALLYLNDSSLSIRNLPGLKQLAPIPDKVPFGHLASTGVINSTRIYVYYQLNTNTIVENEWDDTSGFWIRKEVTIATD
ncbi:MAG: hypothetical protein Q9174_001497 [Haloplaca sp. 1 TL-2023]